MPGNILQIRVGDLVQAAEEGDKLLDALENLGFYLPTACGGLGSCGSCRCRIIEPNVNHNFKEIPYLSLDEQNNGVHLACQTRVYQSMSIEIPPNHASARKFKAIIKDIENLPGKFIKLDLRLAKGDAFRFMPGQYAIVEIPQLANGSEKPDRRAYSIASAPGTDTLSLLISLAQGGKMSNYLEKIAAVNDGLDIIGPFGSFSGFRDEQPELWLAHASGLAPFLSMLAEKFRDSSITRKSITVVVSGDIAASMRRFIDGSILDNPNPAFNLICLPAGKTGLSDWLQHFLADQAANCKDHGYLVCANPGQVEKCLNLLQRAGINKQRVRTDQYFCPSSGS